MLAGLLLLAAAAACGTWLVVRRWRRRRTVYIRMSDAWIRDHADDPLPDHLR
jgi:hypothetical protein